MSGVKPGQVQIAWYNSQGEFIEPIADIMTTRPFPSLSPDGTQVVIAANADDGREIWLFDTTNGNERRLTFEGFRWGEAGWHPDGKRIISSVEPAYDAFLITLDGSEPRQELGSSVLSTISADGQTFFYSKPILSGGFNFDICARPLDAPVAEERVLVNSPAVEWFPLASPDGKYLLYVSEESGRQEIYATTYPGLVGRWQVSRDGGGWMRWRGDGKEIYYCTHNEMFAVAVDLRKRVHAGSPPQAVRQAEHRLVGGLARRIRRDRRRTAVRDGQAGVHGRGCEAGDRRGAELVCGVWEGVMANAGDQHDG